MNNIKSKLTSRKFWITMISVIAGITQLFGADSELIEIACGVLLALVPTAIYVITEGRIDANAAKKLIGEISDELEDISEREN